MKKFITFMLAIIATITTVFANTDNTETTIKTASINVPARVKILEGDSVDVRVFTSDSLNIKYELKDNKFNIYNINPDVDLKDIKTRIIITTPKDIKVIPGEGFYMYVVKRNATIASK